MSPAEAKRTFADLMARARDRKLSLTEKARLSQARQMLRRGRRPAMNPRKSTIYTRASTEELQRVVKQYRQELLTSAILTPKDHRNLRSHIVAIQKELDRRTKTNPARFPHGRHLVELKKIQMGGIPFAFVVIRDGEEIGFITKHRDTRTETHPWKAFVGIGHHATYLGAVYGSDGKARAIQAIVDGIPLEENPIELGYRSPKTGRGRHLSIGVGRSAKSNPPGPQRIGRALEVRYKRDIGRKPGYYKHSIQANAGVYTVSPGWVYVGSKSILITEGKPRV